MTAIVPWTPRLVPTAHATAVRDTEIGAGVGSGVLIGGGLIHHFSNVRKEFLRGVENDLGRLESAFRANKYVGIGAGIALGGAVLGVATWKLYESGDWRLRPPATVQ